MLLKRTVNERVTRLRQRLMSLKAAPAAPTSGASGTAAMLKGKENRKSRIVITEGRVTFIGPTAPIGGRGLSATHEGNEEEDGDDIDDEVATAMRGAGAGAGTREWPPSPIEGLESPPDLSLLRPSQMLRLSHVQPSTPAPAPAPAPPFEWSPESSPRASSPWDPSRDDSPRPFSPVELNLVTSPSTRAVLNEYEGEGEQGGKEGKGEGDEEVQIHMPSPAASPSSDLAWRGEWEPRGGVGADSPSPSPSTPPSSSDRRISMRSSQGREVASPLATPSSPLMLDPLGASGDSDPIVIQGHRQGGNIAHQLRYDSQVEAQSPSGSKSPINYQQHQHQHQQRQEENDSHHDRARGGQLEPDAFNHTRTTSGTLSPLSPRLSNGDSYDHSTLPTPTAGPVSVLSTDVARQMILLSAPVVMPVVVVSEPATQSWIKSSPLKFANQLNRADLLCFSSSVTAPVIEESSQEEQTRVSTEVLIPQDEGLTSTPSDAPQQHALTEGMEQQSSFLEASVHLTEQTTTAQAPMPSEAPQPELSASFPAPFSKPEPQPAPMPTTVPAPAPVPVPGPAPATVPAPMPVAPTPERTESPTPVQSLQPSPSLETSSALATIAELNPAKSSSLAMEVVSTAISLIVESRPQQYTEDTDTRGEHRPTIEKYTTSSPSKSESESQRGESTKISPLSGLTGKIANSDSAPGEREPRVSESETETKVQVSASGPSEAGKGDEMQPTLVVVSPSKLQPLPLASPSKSLTSTSPLPSSPLVSPSGGARQGRRGGALPPLDQQNVDIVSPEMEADILKMNTLRSERDAARKVIMEWAKNFEAQNGRMPTLEDKKKVKPLYVKLKKV